MNEIKAERIAKLMARAGLCSRREAERMILAGRVSLNGTVLDSPAVNVTGKEDIRIDGKRLPKAEPTRLFLYHKPAGLLTTAKDTKARPTIFDKIPKELPRLISIGRLDMNTEGLILLTNDGELARKLELPTTGWKRRYRVRAHGSISQDQLNPLQKGITINKIKYGPIQATLDKQQGANSWVTMGLCEGKNREVRKVMEHLGLQVNRLIRVSYGPFQLGGLPKGALKEVEKKVLQEQISGLF